MRIGFLSLLTVVFITLKLTEVVAWSWWVVLAPIWMGVPLSIIFWLSLFVAIECLDEYKNSRR